MHVNFLHETVRADSPAPSFRLQRKIQIRFLAAL